MLTRSFKLYAEHTILQSVIQRTKNLTKSKSHGKIRIKYPNPTINTSKNSTINTTKNNTVYQKLDPVLDRLHQQLKHINRIPKYPVSSRLEIEILNKLIDSRITNYNNSRTYKYILVTLSKYMSKFNILHYNAIVSTILLFMIW